MGRGQRVREGGAGDLEQEAAKKIARVIQAWRNGHKILVAQKRWLFELLQNALDVSRGQDKEKLRFEILSDSEKIVIKHNAGCFSPKEFRALIEAYSTKPFERDSDYAGRFATGFLITHIVDEVVDIKGILKEEDHLLQFSTQIDRQSENVDKILQNFDKAFNALDDATLVADPLPDCWTEYIYHTRDELARNAVEVGIKELMRTMPFLLAFNKIECIAVNGEEFSLSEAEDKSDGIFVRAVRADRVWVTHHALGDVALVVDAETTQIKTLSDSPRIYVHGLPLTESGAYLRVPFVMNSRLFDTPQERDFLTNTKQNKDILTEAFSSYFKLAQFICQPVKQCQSLFLLSDFHPIKESQNFKSELLDYSNSLISNTLDRIIENLFLVDTVGLGRVTIANTLFPTKTIRGKKLADDDFDKSYDIFRSIKKAIPIRPDLENWISLSSSLKEEFPDVKISFYGIEDLKKSLEQFRDSQNNYPGLSEIGESYGVEEPKDFLLSFLTLINGLYERGIIDTCHFVDGLILDQSDTLGPYDWGDLGLHIDSGIQEDFKDISARVGWNIRQNLVDKDFSHFKTVTDVIGKKLLTSDDALKLLIEKYPLVGKVDEDVTKWSGSTHGWVDLFRWCISNQKLPDGFLIITKDTQEDRIQKVTNLMNEYFVIPFRYVGINEAYERIFPESRVLHNEYFDFENSSQLIQMLTHKVFVKSLPTYSNVARLDCSQLGSLITSGEKVSSATHEIVAPDSCIATLPLWQFVMRRISKNRDLARVFFKFVTECLIKDPKWKEEIVVKCSCKAKEHKIVPTEWLANLITDSWLPYRPDDASDAIMSIKANKEGFKNLFSEEELDQLIIKEPEDVTKLLTYFHFDELDLKVKLQSILKRLPEREIRKEVSSLIDISNALPNLVDVYRRGPEALKQAIDRVKATLDLQPTKDENKIIGENVEQIIEKFLDDGKYGFKPQTVGSDIEVWPNDEGWDAGAVALSHYWIEIKFTSTERVRVSDTQGKLAREKKQHFAVLVVENVGDLRSRLKRKLDRTEITLELSKEIMDNSHIVEDFYTKIGTLPDSEEVEADINGYWIRRKLWGDKEKLSAWIKRVFSVGTQPQSRGVKSR